MKIHAAPTLPAELRADVAEAYRLLEEMCAMEVPAVAVRSSAVDEDGSDASFAGQHETFLNVAGVDGLSGYNEDGKWMRIL